MCEKFTSSSVEGIGAHVKKEHLNLKEGLGCVFEGCTFRGSMMAEMRNHYTSVHESKESREAERTTCLLCGARRRTEGEVMRHIRIVHLKDNEYLCNACGRFATFSLKEWANHVHQNHADNPPKIEFRRSEGFDPSKRLPMTAQPAPEEVVDLTDGPEDNKKVSYTYICSSCKYTTKEISDMSVHVKKHGQNTKFVIKYQNDATKAEGTTTISTNTTSTATTTMAGRSKQLALTGPEEKPGVQFKCFHCPEKFSSKDVLLKHFEKEHDQKASINSISIADAKDKAQSYENLCMLCDKRTQSDEDIKKHIISTHFKTFQSICPHCPHVSSSPADLQAHGQQEHYKHFSLSKLLCAKCDYTSKNIEVMQTHTSKAHSPDEKKVENKENESDDKKEDNKSVKRKREESIENAAKDKTDATETDDSKSKDNAAESPEEKKANEELQSKGEPKVNNNGTPTAENEAVANEATKDTTQKEENKPAVEDNKEKVDVASDEKSKLKSNTENHDEEGKTKPLEAANPTPLVAKNVDGNEKMETDQSSPGIKSSEILSEKEKDTLNGSEKEPKDKNITNDSSGETSKETDNPTIRSESANSVKLGESKETDKTKEEIYQPSQKKSDEKPSDEKTTESSNDTTIVPDKTANTTEQGDDKTSLIANKKESGIKDSENDKVDPKNTENENEEKSLTTPQRSTRSSRSQPSTNTPSAAGSDKTENRIEKSKEPEKKDTRDNDDKSSSTHSTRSTRAHDTPPAKPQEPAPLPKKIKLSQLVEGNKSGLSKSGNNFDAPLPLD